MLKKYAAFLQVSLYSAILMSLNVIGVIKVYFLVVTFGVLPNDCTYKCVQIHNVMDKTLWSIENGSLSGGVDRPKNRFKIQFSGWETFLEKTWAASHRIITNSAAVTPHCCIVTVDIYPAHYISQVLILLPSQLNCCLVCYIVVQLLRTLLPSRYIAASMLHCSPVCREGFLLLPFND